MYSRLEECGYERCKTFDDVKEAITMCPWKISDYSVKFMEELEISHLYVNKNQQEYDISSPVFYFDGVFGQEVERNLNERDYDRYKVFFEKDKQKMYRAYEKGDFGSVVIKAKAPLYPLIFNAFYPKMNYLNKIPNLIGLALRCRYGFDGISSDTLTEIVNTLSLDILRSRKNSRLFDSDGYMTVYYACIEQGSDEYRDKPCWTYKLDVAVEDCEAIDGVTIVVGRVHLRNVIFIFSEEKQYYTEFKEYDDWTEHPNILLLPNKVEIFDEIYPSDIELEEE